MYNNDIERPPSTDFNNINNTNKIKISTRTLMILAIVLAVCRLIPLDILAMISDLLTALMLYFYMQSPNQCMAIFVIFNGIMGLFSSVGKIVQVINLINKNDFNCISLIIICIAIYAVILYLIICMFGFFEMNKDNQQQPVYNNQYLQSAPVNANYGAIPTNDQDNNIKTSNFVAFTGKGTALG